MHARRVVFVESRRFGAGVERAIEARCLIVPRCGITVDGVPDIVPSDDVVARFRRLGVRSTITAQAA